MSNTNDQIQNGFALVINWGDGTPQGFHYSKVLVRLGLWKLCLSLHRYNYEAMHTFLAQDYYIRQIPWQEKRAHATDSATGNGREL